jgi:glycosyltransferase involved in cell wall biosynthesis
MKILIVTQYFWPENFRINDLSVALTERGHEVTVLTGKPNYPKGEFYPNYSFFSRNYEVWNNVRVFRSPLMPRGKAGGLRLMINYLSFAFFNSIRGLFVAGDFDKILVYEPSPVTVGFPAILMKWRKKVPVFFWVQDLWPHSVAAAGGLNHEVVLNILEKVTRWIYKKSDKILIQSEAFRDIIEGQGVPKEKIIFYPNSVEELFRVSEPKPEISSLLPEGFKIMFAGNIGESQDFETIIETAAIVASKNPAIKWVILGDGRKRNYVSERIRELGLQDKFHLLGSYPVEMMPEFYACADCLFVSLKRDYIFSLTIPSKIQSYLACGKPVLASLDGEGGRVVKEARAGMVVEAEKPAKLAAAALEFYDLPQSEREQMGRNARKYFDDNFERELLVNRLEEIFNNGR